MPNRKTSRVLFLILVILLLLAGGWIFFKASNSKDDFHFKPEVIVSGVSVEDSEDEYLRVFPTLQIINDLGVEANVRELEYELTHRNERVLTNLEKKNFTIKKQDTSVVTLSMRIGKVDLQRLNSRIKDMSGDSSRFHLRLVFKLNVPLRGYREFEINRDLDLPLLRVLEVESRKLSLEKFSLKHPELKMALKLKNPNSFPIVLNQCRLKLAVGSDLKLNGEAKGVQRLEAHSTKEITLDLAVEDLKILELAWKSIFKDEKTPFTSELTFRVISNNEMINRSHFVIRKNGTLDEIKGK
jgi:LEA14-like dessication related protein